ncbi:DUF6531 domain-containing protein [Curtobacterium sp. MCPF17_050]|uniref:DUF6531 domain-containing protein n=1 Tax=Curtobacterium sp. MCPF17_050 TaxID=2175664 RepID=UPI0015E89A11|nr:DUF6531 domain-containing protein [Curtobacterium sp. MCPF17_050]WIB16297.1 DUF6531 domain-containing protein [Curtobacterium sp. MCPF17_050]
MTEFVEVPLLPQSDSSNGGKFTYSTASALQSKLLAEAARLEGQAGSRASYVSTAKHDFEGHFSELFATNATTASQDASNLASALRTVAGYVGKMIAAGHEEDARRKENNEWVHRHNNKDFGDQFHDFWFGEDERPNVDPGPAPTFPAAQASTGSRQTPAPGGGGGGGGGGTSSARPEDLRSFATGSRGLDDALAAAPGGIEAALADFASDCSWGHIDAAGVVGAYRRYLSANAEDASWADTIAAAFEAAGGAGAVSTLSDAALGAALQAAGVSASRSSLQIDPPTAAGAMPTSGYANDPVNTSTGNFLEPETDLAFVGASGLALTRMYNSMPSALGTPGVFGPGWASVLDQALLLSDTGARWVRDDGRAVDYPRDGDGFGRAVGENSWLHREPGEGPDGARLVVRDNQGGWWAFDPTGRWLASGRGHGETTTVSRDGSGAVIRLEHEFGRNLEVEYVDGRVAVVRASDGRRMEYGYENGYLGRVTGALGTRTYRWNEDGLIAAVVSAAGVVEAENTYDEQGRVVLQVSQYGRRTRFAYLPGRVTAVSDEDGTRSNSWIADAKGRLVGMLDSADQRQSMTYDASGNLVSSTRRDGSVTVHAHDERGRRTRTVTAEGADLTWGYDAQDRVTTFVTASGSVISYEYPDDVSRNPSVIHDALGGRTELEWDRGRLLRVVDPTGVPLHFAYDRAGDLVAIRNASGETSRTERDAAGRPTAAVSPSGARTEYRYDGAGLLVQRTDADGAEWRFEHDPAGRPTAVVDPTGARTRFEYGANGELVRTTDALGRTVEREFDDLGKVAAVVLPGGGRWAFAHDALSRLTSVMDPAGGTWSREYDVAGNLTASIDPTGLRASATTERDTGTVTIADAFARTTVRFDEYGRPVRVEAEDGSAELVTYDAAGNAVELVDGEGGLTTLERDQAGRVVAVVAASGATTVYEYDACGRPWRTTDPVGGVTELVWDADQRLVARTFPTGESEHFEYDAVGRLTVQRVPGVGTTRFEYDRVGRLVATRGPAFGTRRFTYDAVGQLVRTVNGVGGVTSYDHDDLGRVTRVTGPTGAVTEYQYDDLGQVSGITDPLTRRTVLRYDAAGRPISRTDADGRTTTWTHDASGRPVSTSVDGRLVSVVEHDAARRRVVVHDHTRDDGRVVDHELRFDGRGLLTSRTRDGWGMTWEYGPDGERIASTDTNGVRTTWTRDAAGRAVAVEHPGLGRVEFDRDASGRCIAARAGGHVQSWAFHDGFMTRHTGGSGATLVERDDHGRVSRVTRQGPDDGPARVTTVEYDAAGQLVAVETDAGRSTWEYDLGGRLVAESGPDGTTTHEYDAAGQIRSTEHPDGSRSEYLHDALGRRVAVTDPDGARTEYGWGTIGRLAELVHRPVPGTSDHPATEHRLWVDALGELAEVDDASVWWDTAAAVPTLVAVGGERVLGLPAGLTAVGTTWTTDQWRGARATDVGDPWAVTGTVGSSTAASGFPDDIGVTATGGLVVAGLEWLGARVYDPTARGFLSADPLPPVIGAGWDGNPYAYAGNDPLGAVDPTGLRPLTDAELKAYDSSASRGAFAAAGDFFADNWEYFAGGAMVVAGGVLMATGVGGPAGMMLISAGADTIIQKATTGEVDWGEVALSGALGGFGGAGIAARAGLTGMKASVVAGASSGGIGGGVQGAYGYYTGPGPHSVTGALSATGQGALAGTVTGGAGGAVGQKVSEGIMGAVTRNASADTAVMGRSMEYRVHPYGAAHGYSSYEALPSRVYDWTEAHLPTSVHERVHLWANEKWVDYQKMQGKDMVDIGAPDEALRPAGVDPLGPSAYYDMEQSRVAGYSGYSQDPQPSWDLR